MRHDRISSPRWRHLRAPTAALLVWAAATCVEAIEVDFLRLQDPNLTPPPAVSKLTSRPLAVWLQALSAPETDLRRQAAETLIIAHRLQMPDLAQALPALRQALNAPQQPPMVLAAVARALIALDDRPAAPDLAARAAENLELALIIEPALARWNYAPARQQWLQRVADRQTRQPLRILAIEALGTVGEQAATPQLQALASDAQAEPTLRLPAARALGRLQPQGLEETARSLLSPERAAPAAGAARPAASLTPTTAKAPAVEARVRRQAPMIDRLVAAWLVRQHGSDRARELQSTLALDPEPAIAAVALEPLVEHSFRRVLPLAEQLLASGDATVRHWAAKALVKERTTAAIGQLERLLDDPHPAVRGYVRESLLEMTREPPLRDAVWAATQRTLAGRQWRGLEQAVLITVALEHRDVAGRLVELLDFARPEVYTTAAWGLRRLAVPATAKPMLQKAERIFALQVAANSNPATDAQACHLAEAFRQLQYAEAIPLLRKYVPKNLTLNVGVRSTAIWALGHLYAGKPDAQLAAALSERINDTGHPNAEDDEVRAWSAVALGHMGAASELPTLRAYAPAQPTRTSVDYASGWAIHKITGEPPPQFGEQKTGRVSWFLEPIE